MTAEAFGPSAQRYAASLGAIPALVADSAMPAQALAAAVRRRRTGVPFLSGVLIDDPRARVAYEYSHQLIAAPVDDDGRRRLFDALAVGALTIGGIPQQSIATVSPAALNVLCDVSMMGDGLLARSFAEAERLAALFGGRRRELVVRFPGIDATHPLGAIFGGGDAIVVWAPGLRARETAIFAYALREFYLPVLIACAGRPDFAVPHVEYVAPDEKILARAAAVLDASIGGPETAIALARSGAQLAVSTASGAAEYVDGAVPYDAWSWRSIHAAAQRALAGPAARVREPLPLVQEVAAVAMESRAHLPRGGPLVSVLVATYNHRHLLPQALDALARLDYRDVEIVVVNDGGEAVDDIVARYANARLIVNERNLGAIEATNVGLRAARGEFVAFCSDDDLLFPDTIGRWVWALTRSRASIVNGNTVMRFDRQSPGGAQTLAYQLIWKDNVDHRDCLFTPFTPLSCAMLRRSVVGEVGYYEDTPVADIEYMMRLTRRYDFLHVDQPCVELEYDASRGQSKQVGFAARAEAMQKMYERYPSDSKDVADGRAAKIAWHHQRAQIGSFFEPPMLLPEPERRS